MYGFSLEVVIREFLHFFVFVLFRIVLLRVFGMFSNWKLLFLIEEFIIIIIHCLYLVVLKTSIFRLVLLAKNDFMRWINWRWFLNFNKAVCIVAD